MVGTEPAPEEGPVSHLSRLPWKTWVADEQHWLHDVLSGVGCSRSGDLLEVLSFITLVGVSALAWLGCLGIVFSHVI